MQITNNTFEIAIKRHDLDASDFDNFYKAFCGHLVVIGKK